MNLRLWLLVLAISPPIGRELFADEGNAEEASIRQTPVSIPVHGMKAALDHLANRITASGDRPNITILWLFDQSASMVPVLAETRRGLPRFYKKVFATTREKDGSLQMSASAFGEKHYELTKQCTTYLPTILKAIREIPEDKSGIEKVFHAVQIVAQKANDLGENQSQFLVILTDEKGNGIDQLEAAIKACRDRNHSAP